MNVFEELSILFLNTEDAAERIKLVLQMRMLLWNEGECM